MIVISSCQQHQITDISQNQLIQYLNILVFKLTMLTSQLKKVLITQHSIPAIIPPSQLQSPLNKILSSDIYLSISRYSDSFMVIINQTGTMGSLYKGRFISECLPQLQEQYEDEEMRQHNLALMKNQQPEKIYEIKCLFGSTEIEFYEFLVRKILAVLFEEAKIDSSMKVLVNVSLPVKCKLWEEYEAKYYQVIVSKIKQAIKEVN